MSASPSARAFDALRPAIVVRLLELRSSLDPALARSDEHTARAQIEAVLDDFGEYLATSDLSTHRAFLTAFVAKRAAEELGPSAALSTLVAIGDTAVQVVQEQVAGNHGEELALLVARVTTSSVRIVNDLIATELIRRRGLAHELRSGHRGGRMDTDPDRRGGPVPASAAADHSPARTLARGRRSDEAPRHVAGELTTHPGTDPSTDPGTDPGGSNPGRGARHVRKSVKVRR
jgi:hypothetical protein